MGRSVDGPAPAAQGVDDARCTGQARPDLSPEAGGHPDLSPEAGGRPGLHRGDRRGSAGVGHHDPEGARAGVHPQAGVQGQHERVET